MCCYCWGFYLLLDIIRYYPISIASTGRGPSPMGVLKMWDYIKAVNEAALDDMQNDVENIATIVDDFGACAVEVYNLIDARRKMES